VVDDLSTGSSTSSARLEDGPIRFPVWQNMKGFMRGAGEHWGCRAGQNWLIIRTNGTLAPCFRCTTRRTTGALSQSKVRCPTTLGNEKGCRAELLFNTRVNVAYCYSAARVMKWLWKQAMNGFQASGALNSRRKTERRLNGQWSEPHSFRRHRKGPPKSSFCDLQAASRPLLLVYLSTR